MIKKFLDIRYFGNSVYDYIIAVSIFIISILLISVLKYVVKKYIFKSVNESIESKEHKFNNFKKYLVPLLYLTGFYLAFESLQIPKNVEKIVQTIYIILNTYYIVKFVGRVLNLILTGYINKADEESGKKKIKALTSLFNVLVYVIGFLFLLDNLGINVTAIVAGLGIGGIAVALAAQALLGDLFSYFVIFFDRPFEIGDFITVDTKSGTIEQIGIKSTKIRSLTGELIIVSNSNLTNSRIHNFKALKRRRYVFTISVTYQTTLDKLKIIPNIISNIISMHEKAELDRCTFASFGNSSLNFEIVLFYDSSDYKEFMITLDSINLQIFEDFKKNQIDFAYPTQTIFLEK
ncbi:MAG TPA: mechanosensitive ion channel family protein [Melioribacteraceae bacterium]|nr:mechanosensitive ion channel family protein [Melioribacteraceae bacterium]